MSELVILHEQSESGLPIPDLSASIQAVGLAVRNLAEVCNAVHLLYLRRSSISEIRKSLRLRHKGHEFESNLWATSI